MNFTSFHTYYFCLFELPMELDRIQFSMHNAVSYVSYFIELCVVYVAIKDLLIVSIRIAMNWLTLMRFDTLIDVFVYIWSGWIMFECNLFIDGWIDISFCVRTRNRCHIVMCINKLRCLTAINRQKTYEKRPHVRTTLFRIEI